MRLPLLFALSILSLLSLSSCWIAVSPTIMRDPLPGTSWPATMVDVFQLDDTGAEVKDILSFPVADGDAVDPNALACGRCFCLILTTNVATQTSTLYNMSFCLVPSPIVQSSLDLPGIAYNLHSMEGEGDGGNGYTVLIDRTTTPQTFSVLQVVGQTFRKRVDISAYVNAFGGNVYPGGTAFCAESLTLWVAVQTSSPTHDTMLTVSLASNSVVANVSIPKPALAAHFADCTTNLVGGVTQQAGGTVVLGQLSIEGAFTVLVSAKLPAGSAGLRLAGAMDFLHDPKRVPFAAPEYGALLYAPDANGTLQLPGLLFTSTAGKSGPAKFAALQALAAAISVEY
jgi:hypothetical protein